MFAFVDESILEDSELKSNEKIIISLFLLYAYKSRQKNFPAIDTEMISNSIGRNRDHTKRILNAMCENPVVQKYCKIKIQRRNNLPSIYKIKFSESILMPGSVNVLNEKTFVPNDYFIPIQKYNQRSKYFSGFSIPKLFSICEDQNEMIKALIYIDALKNVRNPVAYLSTSFNENGKFKYQTFKNPVTKENIKHSAYTAKKFKISLSDYENLIGLNGFKVIGAKYKDCFVITSILERNRYRNIYAVLQANSIKFSIHE